MVLIAFLVLCTLGVIYCKCGQDEYLLQKSIRVESNGCSKPEFIQVQGEEDFTYCCDRHDACYATCGASQQFCDSDFKKCMKSLCLTEFPTNPQCVTAAETYAMGPMIFGTGGKNIVALSCSIFSNLFICLIPIFRPLRL